MRFIVKILKRRALLAGAAGVSLLVVAASSAGLAPRLAASRSEAPGNAPIACPAGQATDSASPLVRAGAALCSPVGRPEGIADIASLEQYRQLRLAGAPGLAVDPAAVAQGNAQVDRARARSAAAGSSSPDAGPTWVAMGKDALYANDPAYASTNVEGWGNLSGRITAFAFDPSAVDPAHRRFFASAVNGGVWESNDTAKTWRSIGDGIPTTVVGGLGFSPSRGGTIIAATGDTATGRYSIFGRGVFWSSDDGATWHRAAGIPDGAFAFRVAVDPRADGKTIYVATSMGLYRSGDASATFENVVLPTGCTDLANPKCGFANFVSDVVVRSTDANGAGEGKVLAAVGYRYGGVRNLFDSKGKDTGVPMAPRDGIYTSDTGVKGSFQFQDPSTGNGFLSTPSVGRVALGIAHGPGQNHDLVYALVQDASKAQGCIQELDYINCAFPNADPGILTNSNKVVQPTVLDGMYVSPDFGKSWNKIMDADSLRRPGNNSTLGGPGVLQAAGSGPGIQAWYNEWVDPDPTDTDPVTGAPLRVAFGLEEIWENTLPIPQGGAGAVNHLALEDWKVIGRYWNSCSGLTVDPTSVPCNGGAPTGTTTHPDQHAGIFIPSPGGGVDLLAGNDGGIYIQHGDAVNDFSNLGWGDGNNHGIHTLLSYHVDVANDGTIISGLQDNGTMKISPDGREQMMFGGDGFFAGIDPANSQNMLEEYVGGGTRSSQDGGKTWTSNAPNLTNAQFSTPFQRDPLDAKHYLFAGQEIDETHAAYTGGFGQVYDLKAPNSTTALDLNGKTAYAAYCGNCYLVDAAPFTTGLATSYGGKWHKVAGAGLPTRIVTSIRMDPANLKTVYVTVAGYLPHYIGEGGIPDVLNLGINSAHVFKSTDAGEHFVDISGNLPNAPANWSVLYKGRLVVATELGVFISSDSNGGSYDLLGTGLPNAPINTMTFKPDNQNLLYVASFGRGIYRVDLSTLSATGAGSTQVSPPASPAVDHLPNSSAAPALLPVTLMLLIGLAGLVMGVRQRRVVRGG
ncbi:MAG: WD40/YVTN/BNR-like repeat-containing protein [Candidatus Dormibacteria bacterium]